MCEPEQQQAGQPQHEHRLPPGKHGGNSCIRCRYGGADRPAPVQAWFPASHQIVLPDAASDRTGSNSVTRPGLVGSGLPDSEDAGRERRINRFTPCEIRLWRHFDLGIKDFSGLPGRKGEAPRHSALSQKSHAGTRPLAGQKREFEPFKMFPVWVYGASGPGRFRAFAPELMRRNMVLTRCFRRALQRPSTLRRAIDRQEFLPHVPSIFAARGHPIPLPLQVSGSASHQHRECTLRQLHRGLAGFLLPES